MSSSVFCLHLLHPIPAVTSFSTFFRFIGVVLLIATGTVIARSAPNVAQPAEVLPSLPEVSAKPDYILNPSDTLQVRVFQEDELTREISISQEYTISLPLIGIVNLREKSVRQAEELIRSLYDKDFLKNPQVTVTVLRYAERTVNVIGQVNSPGAIPFPVEQGLTLLEAITRAGGFNRIADQKDVRITRTDEKGIPKTFSINVMRLIDARSSNLWSLQVGDIVFVPETTF
jgi:polysaccharide biosynthesis/export protein